jgi:methylated-DNA-protein-cysteine methyltransferase related protein
VSPFRDRVEAVVAALADGEVVTYGEVAAQAGSPGAARGVGSVLRTARTPLPWWRVVAAGGRLTAPSATEQARRLRAEGIDVRGGLVRYPLTGGEEDA